MIIKTEQSSTDGNFEVTTVNFWIILYQTASIQLEPQDIIQAWRFIRPIYMYFRPQPTCLPTCQFKQLSRLFSCCFFIHFHRLRNVSHCLNIEYFQVKGTVSKSRAQACQSSADRQWVTLFLFFWCALWTWRLRLQKAEFKNCPSARTLTVILLLFLINKLFLWSVSKATRAENPEGFEHFCYRDDQGTV